MDDVEVKQAVDGLTSAFEEFKRANEERLRQIESKGSADPLTEQKLAKLNERIDQYEPLNQRVTAVAAEAKAARESAEQAELKAGRWHGGGEAGAGGKAERKAFDAWLRRGKEGMDAIEVKVLKVSDDTSAGYLAPPEYVREIIKGEVEFSPLRTAVRVRQTTARSVQVPKRTGTFAARWVAEIQTRAETPGLTYGLEELPTHELTAEVYVSTQELEDSAFDLEAELRQEFAEQFGVAEGAALVAGNGVGKPEGILFNPQVATVASTAATAVTTDAFVDLFYGIKTAYARNGSFVLNRHTLGGVRKLKTTDGAYVWQPGIAEGVPNTIMGASYTEVPDMPNEGAGARPVAFGDWRRGYMLVDRIAMTTLRDPFTRASVGQVKFVARKRVGGQVVLPEAIRVMVCQA